MHHSCNKLGNYELIKYIKNDDEFNIKIGVITLSLFFGITLLINYVGLLLVENFVFLGMLLLFGYMATYNIKHKKNKFNKYWSN